MSKQDTIHTLYSQYSISIILGNKDQAVRYYQEYLIECSNTIQVLNLPIYNN